MHQDAATAMPTTIYQSHCYCYDQASSKPTTTTTTTTPFVLSLHQALQVVLLPYLLVLQHT